MQLEPPNLELVKLCLTNAQGWWPEFSGECHEHPQLEQFLSSDPFAAPPVVNRWSIYAFFGDLLQWSALDPNDAQSPRWDPRIESYQAYKDQYPDAIPFIKI